MYVGGVKRWSEQISKVCLTIIVVKSGLGVVIIIGFGTQMLVGVSPDFTGESDFFIWEHDCHLFAKIVGSSAG